MKYTLPILIPLSLFMISCGQIQDIVPMPEIPFFGSQSAPSDPDEITGAKGTNSKNANAKADQGKRDIAAQDRETSRAAPRTSAAEKSVTRNVEASEFFKQARTIGIGTSERVLIRRLGPPHATVDMGAEKVHMYHGVMLTIADDHIVSMPDDFTEKLQRGIESEMLADASRSSSRSHGLQRPESRLESSSDERKAEVKEAKPHNQGSVMARRKMIQDVMDMVRSE